MIVSGKDPRTTPSSRRAAATLTALLVGLSLAACSDVDPAALPVPSATATLEDVPTSAPSLSASPEQAAPTATPASQTATPRGSSGAGSRFPTASRSLQQGGRYWAVYLAVTRTGADGNPVDDGPLERASAQAEAVGYDGDVGIGDLGCQQGAQEGLELDPARSYVGTSILFDTREQAQQFVDAFQPPVIGTVRVTAFCMD